jgi:hypothetical protein
LRGRRARRIFFAMDPHDSALEDARRAGFDLDLLDSNLALTPEARVLRHESALELCLELRRAASIAHEKPAPAAAKTR